MLEPTTMVPKYDEIDVMYLSSMPGHGEAVAHWCGGKLYRREGISMYTIDFMGPHGIEEAMSGDFIILDQWGDFSVSRPPHVSDLYEEKGAAV